MRTSLRYAALFSLPPAIALGIGVTLLTGELSYGVTACLLVGGGILALVLVGSEMGSPDEELVE
jgi:hypothetical protein